jgi:Peptidase family M28
MKKILVVFATIVSATTFAQNTKQLTKIASTITPDDLRSKLAIIASAQMEGHETAMPGQKRAAAYIENFFKQLGLQPGTSTGYQLNYPVYQDSVASISLKINGAELKEGQDYNISANTAIKSDFKDTSIVFIGFGITDSLQDDFKNVDVKNKWIVFAEGNAQDADKPVVEYPFRNPASSYQKLFNARKADVQGIIIISKNVSALPKITKGNMYVKESSRKNIPMLYITPQTASLIFSKPLNTFSDVKNIPSGNYACNLSFQCNAVTQNMESSDVIGVLPGTDKKDEYVFVTGHYDHLGKRDSVIYYGADDDGSGTTSVLEIAETFVKAKENGFAPRRTMVFMTVSGEEKGLWGSDYYTSHPVFPLDSTSVDLNIDMVGRIDPERNYGDSTNYVYTIGEDKLSSDLQPISDSINNKFSHLELDRKYNDLKDPNRFYYRSDHYNFAKHGVPIIFYFNGTHADYHRPTDTIDKINFDLMAKRVKFIFYTAWTMTNRDNMLKRDMPLK